MAEKVVGALVHGVVSAREGGDLLLDVEGQRARLGASHSNPRDVVDAGTTLACSVIDADASRPGELQLSRTQPALVEELLRCHIPAIRSGTVRVVKVARIAGYKSKITVAAIDDDEDPIHATTRNRPAIKRVLEELGGEDLDILPHVEDIARLVLFLFDRLGVQGILIDEGNHAIEVTVPGGAPAAIFGVDVGQELALASSLTGFRVEFREG